MARHQDLGTLFDFDTTNGLDVQTNHTEATGKSRVLPKSVPRALKEKPIFETLSQQNDWWRDSFPKDLDGISIAYETKLGVLFGEDCMKVLPQVGTETIDTVFADPPFNLKKEYGARSDDNLAEDVYLNWCYSWLDECARVLKPGGALFVYNLPKWNILLGAYLMRKGLEFRHNIAVDIKSTLPIQGRLYPSNYSLLYFTKGKPKTFRKIRTPLETCRHCGGEIRDYGGHRHAMNPNGANLRDVWTDIPPVRHWKFKSKNRKANALSTKLLDRVVEISTFPGEIILDPFGGSGTTFAVCEARNRRWIGIELDFAPEIIERLTGNEIQPHRNDDFVEG